MAYHVSTGLVRKSLTGIVVALLLLMGLLGPAQAELVQFVYTSDQHYGIARKTFRGLDKVSSREVNAALVQAINGLPGVKLPEDGGVRAGQPVQWADAVISTGDIANRMEGTDERLHPSATECWQLFQRQYIDGVTIRNRKGVTADVLAIPGNHDVTNAVGFYRAMSPAKDNGSLVAMYNRANGTALSPEAFDVQRDKVFLNREYGGVRFLLVQMWPDSTAREWIGKQTAALPSGEPVLLFTHDQPDIEAKHLVNPNGPDGIGGINGKDKFENLVSDISSVKKAKETPIREHRELASFLKEQPAIAAYFHGNENYNEFYTWHGPDNDIAMPVFRVDSPMKGNESGKDETRLSFQLVSIDTDTRKMTVREVLWNADPKQPAIAWGANRTISF